MGGNPQLTKMCHPPWVPALNSITHQLHYFALLHYSEWPPPTSFTSKSSAWSPPSYQPVKSSCVLGLCFILLCFQNCCSSLGSKISCTSKLWSLVKFYIYICRRRTSHSLHLTCHRIIEPSSTFHISLHAQMTGCGRKRVQRVHKVLLYQTCQPGDDTFPNC